MSGRHCGGGVGPAKYYLSLSAPVVQCQDAAALVVVAHYTNSHNERHAASGSVSPLRMRSTWDSGGDSL